MRNKILILFSFLLGSTAIADASATCTSMKQSRSSCSSNFKGIQFDRCQVCREGKSCLTLEGAERNLCEAYIENKSCFIALGTIEGQWCKVLKEKKSCFLSLTGKDREQCEKGNFPVAHLFWGN